MSAPVVHKLGPDVLFPISRCLRAWKWWDADPGTFTIIFSPGFDEEAIKAVKNMPIICKRLNLMKRMAKRWRDCVRSDAATKDVSLYQESQQLKFILVVRAVVVPVGRK